jgi:antitoxin (DNA-binding transcriptional repressor) of toxin-antitoxin stability system
MNTRLTVGEFKANFSQVIEIVKQGGSVEVEYGRNRKVVGVFAPPKDLNQRKLGMLEGKAHFSNERGLETGYRYLPESMKALLDTCALLWTLMEPLRLSLESAGDSAER